MRTFLLLSACSLVLFASCKKDYSCSCTRTLSSFGVSDVETYSFSIKEASKKQADAACNEAVVTQILIENGFSETKCELSK